MSADHGTRTPEDHGAPPQIKRGRLMLWTLIATAVLTVALHGQQGGNADPNSRGRGQPVEREQHAGFL
jgi:hypothetical protein